MKRRCETPLNIADMKACLLDTEWVSANPITCELYKETVANWEALGEDILFEDGSYGKSVLIRVTESTANS